MQMIISLSLIKSKTMHRHQRAALPATKVTKSSGDYRGNFSRHFFSIHLGDQKDRILERCLHNCLSFSNPSKLGCSAFNRIL